MSAVKLCLKLLCDNPSTVKPEVVEAAFADIMAGEATLTQIGAFLIALRLRGELPEDIAACAHVLRDHAEFCEIEDALDITGTGGDGIDTINASTCAAFVVAACGAKVAKHGNRASQSKCGSADLVEQLGANLDLDGHQVADIVTECNFGFLFAQKFHPAMRGIALVRRELGVRTIFNVLGPLTNPAHPKYQLTGVNSAALGQVMSEALLHSGVKRAMVVHSAEGMDEISPAETTHCWILQDGVITQRDVRPDTDFGLPLHSLSEVRGGTADHNVAAFKKVLNGEPGPVLDFILLQASAGLFVRGFVSDFKEGVVMARQAITSGKVAELVDRYVALSRKHVAPVSSTPGQRK